LSVSVGGAGSTGVGRVTQKGRWVYQRPFCVLPCCWVELPAGSAEGPLAVIRLRGKPRSWHDRLHIYARGDVSLMLGIGAVSAAHVGPVLRPEIRRDADWQVSAYLSTEYFVLVGSAVAAERMLGNISMHFHVIELTTPTRQL